MKYDGNHGTNNVWHHIAMQKIWITPSKLDIWYSHYMSKTLQVQTIFKKIHQDESLIHLMIKNSYIVIITFN